MHIKMVEILFFPPLLFEICAVFDLYEPDMADMVMESQLTMLQDSTNGLLRFVAISLYHSF